MIRRKRNLAPPDFALATQEDAGPLDRVFAHQRRAHPGGSGVRLVALGSEAFALRVLSARAAVRCLDLQYYIWHSDTTGRYLGSEVLAAADRGVRVRLLLDDMDARSRHGLLMALDQHPLIEVRLFNPFATRSGILRTARELLLRGSRLNHRMHNKAWIADGRVALVGGRNIGDEYFAASSSVNFVDLDVVLAGSAVDETSRLFDAYWNSEAAIPIERLRSNQRTRHALDEIRGARAEVATHEGAEYLQHLRGSPQVHDLLTGDYALTWTTQVQVIADDPRKALKGADEIEPGVLQSLYDAFGKARRELLLISPYFVPSATGTVQLTEKAAQGCEVAVLTNSLAATDVAAVHSGYAKYRRLLLAGGVRLFELKPAPEADERGDWARHGLRLRLGSSKASLHTKAAILDRQRVFVGSFNLDPRSATLNCEMGAWIEDPTLAEQMRAMFAAGATPHSSFAVSLDERGRLLWTESVAGTSTIHRRDPYASWGRRCITWLLRLLPIESQL